MRSESPDRLGVKRAKGSVKCAVSLFIRLEFKALRSFLLSSTFHVNYRIKRAVFFFLGSNSLL